MHLATTLQADLIEPIGALCLNATGSSKGLPRWKEGQVTLPHGRSRRASHFAGGLSPVNETSTALFVAR
jgi:hypothetical protein